MDLPWTKAIHEHTNTNANANTNANGPVLGKYGAHAISTIIVKTRGLSIVTCITNVYPCK